MNFHPISDIRHPAVHKSAQWLRGKPLACDNNGLRFKISRSEKYFLDIGYRKMDSDVDIRTLSMSK
jgi:hypothetical protein